MGDLAGGSSEKFFIKLPDGYSSMTHAQRRAWSAAASRVIVRNLQRKRSDEDEKPTGEGNPDPAS